MWAEKKAVANGGKSGIIETERSITIRTFKKAVEYAKNDLSLSIEKLSELSVENVYIINNYIRKLYNEIPTLKGFIDEVIIEQMNDIAKASMRWTDGKPQIRLKLSRDYFTNMSIKEIENYISICSENHIFTTKDGLYGVLKHEFAHLAEYKKTLKKYNYVQSDVTMSLDECELANRIKELAFKNCELDNTDLNVENYLSIYAKYNSAEFIAEAYSSEDNNILVAEVKRLLKRKWGI